jgi:hypothetical protein
VLRQPGGRLRGVEQAPVEIRVQGALYDRRVARAVRSRIGSGRSPISWRCRVTFGAIGSFARRVACASGLLAEHGPLSRALCDPGEDVVAPQDELGLGQMREDLVREVAAVPLGKDRIVRCVEEQCAGKFASAYPRSTPCV